MFRLISDLPDNVLGVEATSKVTGDDYDQMLLPALKKKRAAHDKVRILYVLGEEFEGYEAGAMWEDMKLGFQDPRIWEKIAIVTDNDRVKHGISALGWMIPGEVRVFELDDLDDAREWITA